jgi:hypothetical protein
MSDSVPEFAGQPATMPHAFSGVRAKSATTAAIQHPSQFAVVSVKTTAVCERAPWWSWWS